MMRGIRRPELNPILVREVRTRMRGARPYAVLTLFLVLLSLAGALIYAVTMQQARFGIIVMSAQIGQALFRGLAFCVLSLIVLMTPALTSGAISSERERQTYDMLLATPLQPGQILWGKLTAALSYLWLLIFAAVPIFSVILVFGGVEPIALLKTLALFLATALTFGMIGLCCSSLFNRTTRATIAAYGVVLTILATTLTVAGLWSQIAMGSNPLPPPWLLYLNPFSALTAITSIAPSGGPGEPFFGYGDPFGGMPLTAIFANGVIHYGPNGPIVLPIYRATLLSYLVLSVLLGWLSAHLALSLQRWRPRWFDLGFGLLLMALLSIGYATRSWWYILPPPQF